MGQTGKANGSVYQFSIARAEKVMDSNMEIPSSMGVAHAINFQPTGGGKAAITGDFVLIASEVNPVISHTANKGIEVIQPSIAINACRINHACSLFMHFFGHTMMPLKLSARDSPPRSYRTKLGRPTFVNLDNRGRDPGPVDYYAVTLAKPTRKN
jgi:hypothetical protein